MILSERFKTNHLDEIPDGGVRLYDIVDKNGNKIESNVKLVRSNGNKQEGDVFDAKLLNEIGAFLNDLEMQTAFIVDDTYNFAHLQIIPSEKLAFLNYTRKIAVGNGTTVLKLGKTYAPVGTRYAYDRFHQPSGYGLIKLLMDANGDITLSAVNYNDLVAGSFALCWTFK